MKTRKRWSLLALLMAFMIVAAACSDDDDSSDTTAAAEEEAATEETAAAEEEEMADTTEAAAEEEPAEEEAAEGGDVDTIGVILVGPENDRGWSQAHAEGIAYVAEQLGAEVITLDVVNPVDRPETTVEAVVADMRDQGADIVFATSDDMKDGVELAAEQNPDFPLVWSSGDSAWVDGKAYREDLTMLANAMGQMEFGKAMAGCAAALTTQTGQIGYLGPLINDETRRLVNSVYLGAQYCWENVRGEDPADLQFRVDWIGFWFNIPGVTLDPTAVANAFYDDGFDVVISGIDTTQALVVAGQRAEAGEAVYAVPYDFIDACAEAPDICLGVPYFNWGPEYLGIVNSVADGSFSNTFSWFGPDWADINNPDTSGVGWVNGDGLLAHPDRVEALDEFIAGLGDGSIKLWVGPINYQDGSAWLADGEEASDFQIWYTEQLLEGIEGASEA
jgi:simple sugar transport system substrate-binding protein